MIAVRYYGSANAEGYPAQWPRQISTVPDDAKLPPGFDVQMTPEEYKAHLASLRAEYDVAEAARAKAASDAVKARLDQHGDLFRQLAVAEANWNTLTAAQKADAIRLTIRVLLGARSLLQNDQL